jgi:solute carrier family 9B (sodium/hydrogen exchanger), member 1/2
LIIILIRAGLSLNISDLKKVGRPAIPQMILAGASVDDVFVIVMFTTFSGLLFLQ